MSDRENIRIIGLEDLHGKLQEPEWVERPARRFLESWGSRVEREAKANVSNLGRGPGSWLDTAETRKSLTHEVDNAALPLFARAGSNLMKARWGDLGTGLLSEDPESPKRRHWPPASALERFVAKKQPKDREGRLLTAADVARAIGMRGGLAPRRFLRDADETVAAELPGMVKDFAKDIEKEAERGAH